MSSPSSEPSSPPGDALKGLRLEDAKAGTCPDRSEEELDIWEPVYIIAWYRCVYCQVQEMPD